MFDAVGRALSLATVGAVALTSIKSISHVLQAWRDATRKLRFLATIAALVTFGLFPMF